jgi:hypothetical protein
MSWPVIAPSGENSSHPSAKPAHSGVDIASMEESLFLPLADGESVWDWIDAGPKEPTCGSVALLRAYQGDEPYRPSRNWSGVKVLPVESIVDTDDRERLELGELMLVADSGLTRSGVLLKVLDARTVLVRVL